MKGFMNVLKKIVLYPTLIIIAILVQLFKLIHKLGHLIELIFTKLVESLEEAARVLHRML